MPQNEDNFLQDCLSYTENFGDAAAFVAGGAAGTALMAAAAGESAAPVTWPAAVATALSASAMAATVASEVEPQAENLWGNVCVDADNFRNDLHDAQEKMENFWDDIVNPPTPPAYSPDLASSFPDEQTSLESDSFASASTQDSFGSDDGGSSISDSGSSSDV